MLVAAANYITFRIGGLKVFPSMIVTASIAPTMLAPFKFSIGIGQIMFQGQIKS